MLESSPSLKAVFGGGTISEGFLKYALDLSGAEKPKVAIAATPKQLPTTFEEYVARLTRRFEGMGIESRVLHRFGEVPDEEIIEWADVLNVSGGNTERMMQIWEQTGIDRRIRAAANAGKLVMNGVSAGAIVGFTGGFSDSKSYIAHEAEPWSYEYIPGLNLVNKTIITPHFDKPDKSQLNHKAGRAGAFIDWIQVEKDHTNTYLGIDNSAALVINEGAQTTYRADSVADVYRLEKQEDGTTITIPFRN